MLDYSQILSVNYPTAQWSLSGDSYDGLTWLSNTPKPTQAELDALAIPTQTAVAEQKAQAIAVKESALTKLAALGLTEDEVKALVG
jgi:hypothetical protein